MRRMRIACAATFGAAIVAASFPADLTAQIPTPPPKVHGCLRTDVEKTKELMRKAMEKGTPEEDVVEVQKEVQGCTAYTITFQSAISIVSHGPAGGTSKISGTGSITFGLAPDVSAPEYDLTSGPSELNAPIYWSGAEIALGNKCIVRTIALPATEFSFWLGVRSGAQPTATVRTIPAGDELHATMTKCPMPMGGYSNEIPGKAMIFIPAWTALHANMAAGPMAPGMDMEKMKAMAAQKPGQGMDMKKLMEMSDKLKDKPPSPDNTADMMKLMKAAVPDADQQVEAARNNFVFKMPGDCVPAGAVFARCTINRTVTLPDGRGATQTITEATVITIAKGPGR